MILYGTKVLYCIPYAFMFTMCSIIGGGDTLDKRRAPVTIEKSKIPSRLREKSPGLWGWVRIFPDVMILYGTKVLYCIPYAFTQWTMFTMCSIIGGGDTLDKRRAPVTIEKSKIPSRLCYDTVWHQGSLLYPVCLYPVSRERKGKARRRKECSYVTETGFYFFRSLREPSFCLAYLHPL
jgi:hypothetical protein